MNDIGTEKKDLINLIMKIYIRLAKDIPESVRGDLAIAVFNRICFREEIVEKCQKDDVAMQRKYEADLALWEKQNQRLEDDKTTFLNSMQAVNLGLAQIQADLELLKTLAVKK